MTKNNIVLVMIAGLAIWSGVPSFANSSAKSGTSSGSIPGANSLSGLGDSASTSNVKSSSSQASLPKKLLGVVTGIIVGVPVCLVRKPIDEEKYGVQSIDDNNPKPRLTVPAAIFWAPFAVTTGILEAPFWAVTNSLSSFNKPFSKRQLSLIDIPEETEIEPYSAPH